MSDQPSQPPKPKPGSLRDRIAAFEKTATAAPSAPAPAPRPKPAGFGSWKPKVPSPPSSPSTSASAVASTDHASSSASKVGGMSASDAKESITKAGSLKDRMAALQGKGAFGAPAPPTAPKPAVEKPKWKPPPVVHAPADDDDHAGEHTTAAVAAAVERTLSPPVSVKSHESVDNASTPDVRDESAAPAPVQESEQESEPAAVDPQDEERQRRAAIAARMARLGGARVGMAPPVIGKKPVRKPTQEELPAPKKEEIKTVEEPAVGDAASSEVSKSAEGHVSPPLVATEIVASPPSDAPIQDRAEAEVSKSPEIVPTRKSSEAASILSSETTDSHSSRNPTSMPIPSVPRRAGPPRKKPAKTPTLPGSDVPEEKAEEPVHTPAGGSNVKKVPDAHVEAGHTEKATNDAAETDNSIPSLDEPTGKTEQPALIEEADVPESRENESASSVYLDSPLATSTLTEEVSGIRSPPPSSLSSGQDIVPDDEIEAAAITTDSPAVPVLHSSPHALHEDDVTRAHHEEEVVNVPEALEADEEEDAAEEEARKKRIADRIGKMGGINPLAPRPPAPISPPAQETRSPPLDPAKFIPSSTTPVAVPETEHKVDPSPYLGNTHSAPKESDLGSKAEEESSDEDEGESGVLDDQRTPSASREQDEKPKTADLPHSKSHPGSVTVASPPPPIPSTRPPVQVQQYVEQEKEEEEESDYGDDESLEEEPVAAPMRPNNPPGQPTTSNSPASQHLNEAPSPPSRPAQPPRRIIPQAPEQFEDEEDEDEETDEEADERLATSQLFVPPPSGRGPVAIQPRGGRSQDEEDGDGSENDTPALPVPHRVSSEALPPKNVARHDDSEADSDHDGQALPIPPRRTAVPRMAQPPATASQDQEGVQHPFHGQRELQAVPSGQNVPRPGQITPSLSVSGSEEILDEEEGDPIDPAFHSPSRQTSFVNLRSISQAQEEIAAQAPVSPSIGRSPPAHSPVVPATSAPTTALQHDEETKQDAEQLRRKSIAERMAKLGGIRFGAAPLPTPAGRPQPRQEEQKDAGSSVPEEEPAEALSEEEEERARKERIAAKLATMGGMRIGMMPMGAGGLPPQRSHVLREENVNRSTPAPAPAPARAIPPSRPPPPAAPVQAAQGHDTDSDYGSAAASEDGVKVEAEESEVEESGYEHVEEAPPPVPSRATRASLHRQSTGPSSPPSRPPVPTAIPMRRSSTIQSTKSARSASGEEAASSPQQRRTSYMPQSEYVMVEEPESQEPPPPARPSMRAPPTRSTPQVPQPPTMTQAPNMGDSISSQWELPSIPDSSLDFGGGPGADLSMSWTDAAEPTSSVAATQPQSSPPPPPPPSKAVPSSISERQLSADDLMALWGRVGVQVCEVATSLYEKSRKTLIGDGSYAGFVRDVLAAVPNAAPVPSAAGEYGYTVYVQNGPAVVKRASEIMPGDVVEIHDAKLKGHKGLQTYHQTVGGAGETLIGVVGEFEAKKSKIRVFHANQHVGQQTVESVSYRLEDLKSGIVKVYRVLDA
ncbi:hypothetical protein CVT25_005349 [Psilocybe cyanescens]|uniref:BBC1/AIM3 cysteine proteinase-fold domain-containing protein n=1 Tax=Psilocybe cyanescens TaxID=93625 RepID=A0A409VW39_PSICY|nr:hypothetical protein CVT25_005349 [Psilocybe cyanescens]